MPSPDLLMTASIVTGFLLGPILCFVIIRRLRALGSNPQSNPKFWGYSSALTTIIGFNLWVLTMGSPMGWFVLAAAFPLILLFYTGLGYIAGFSVASIVLRFLK